MQPIQTFRNPILSLWQSAIHEAALAESHAAPEQVRPVTRLSAGHPLMIQFVSAVQARLSGQPVAPSDALRDVTVDCVNLVVELAWAEIKGDQQRVATLIDELKASTCDPLWIEALAVYERFRSSGGTIPYIRHTSLDDFVLALPDRPGSLVIALIADWGTGADDARFLLAQVMQRQPAPDVLIHLGDIYYAGTQTEVQTNFLELAAELAPAAQVYTLSGNHDMYSGGQPYYSALAHLHQPASYFCLRNQYWQLLALDTGLHDCDPTSVVSNVTYLDPAEATWHLDKIANSGGRKTVLLSHHQLFSAFGDGVGLNAQQQPLAFNPYLYGTFGAVLDQVALWLWGHEHNLIKFEPYLGLQQGRCIGSGAIPVMLDQQPYTPNPHVDMQGQAQPPQFDPTVELSTNADGFYYHAYAIMQLDGPDATISYYQVDALSQDASTSRLLWSERVGQPGQPS